MRSPVEARTGALEWRHRKIKMTRTPVSGRRGFDERKRGRNSELFVEAALEIPSPGKNKANKLMLHLIWYILVGLIAGVIAKSVMHVHMTIFWTIVLGIIGSILGGAVTHMFAPPVNRRFHPAGLIVSTLGAILLLFIASNCGSISR